MTARASSTDRIGFLGPHGTFTEEALLSQEDLAGARCIPLASFVEVLRSVEQGETDLGFVAIENSIEGTVAVTVDQLIFERDLWIVGEVVLDVTQNLLLVPGATLAELKTVVSYPHATAQCRRWLAVNLPNVEQVGATSTAAAAESVASEADPAVAAIGTRLAGSTYGLDVGVPDIADHDGNSTRFVLVARPDRGLPPPSGHDRTTVVCFQSADHPGSLYGILGQFAARNLNLTKLESRPTKQGLGSYCFLIDVEGHVGDEVVGDCLKDLHATLPSVKFLGSYGAAGEHAAAVRREASAAWDAADAWMKGLRSAILG